LCAANSAVVYQVLSVVTAIHFPSLLIVITALKY